MSSIIEVSFDWSSNRSNQYFVTIVLENVFVVIEFVKNLIANTMVYDEIGARFIKQ